MLFKREKLNIGLVFLALGILPQVNIQASNPARKLITPTIAAAAIVATAGVAGINYLRTPDRSMPTFEQLNAVTILPTGCPATAVVPKEKADVLQVLKKKSGLINIKGSIYSVHKGVHPDIKSYDGPITIYSGGYSNDCNPYAYCGYVAQKVGVIPGAVVTFEFPADTRAGFNFCGEQDNVCPRLVCEEIVKANPAAKIILHGACKGGMNNLKFYSSSAQKLKGYTAEEVQSNPELSTLSNLLHRHIKLVVTESPPRTAVDGVKNQVGGSITPYLMRAVFPNYDHEAKTIMDAREFPGTSMFLASLPHDSLSVLDEMREMTEHLNGLRRDKVNEPMGRPSSPIHHFVSGQSEIIHGQIGKAKDYQAALRQVYQEHNLLPVDQSSSSSDIAKK